MDLGTEGSDPRSPAMRHPTDQPPCQQNSFKETGSDVAEKPLEGKEETFSSVLRESCTQRQGSVPKTDENSKETELKRDSGVSGSGASLAAERSVTPGKKRPRAPDEDHGSEGEETADARPRRRRARRGGRGGRGWRSRHRSPGHRPPPLRKRLVTTLRALSEAIYQDVAQACEQQEHSPLTWEQRSGLGELWGPLDAALQTVYAMAKQAAYVFPAESWLVPGPPPGPGAPARGGGEARGSPGPELG
ncbi:protein FRG2-like-1 [Neomonachus schauinslandi]|uniref:Protein FRG2-like-1 n=1 Tax=Neomonachus schauinslandi TaxID=29088 RepID=A0A2Y9GFW8_NEOSC|nr:protein FRG2-like-1 [Neomonachus schauinslandi]